MRSNCGWRRLAALALSALLCSAAWADPPGRVGRLADMHGTVWLMDNQSGEWYVAERNRPITTGDRIATDHDARAQLEIGSTTVRLAGDTQVDVLQLDDQNMNFQLLTGSLAARLRGRDTATQFEVRTAEGRFLPARTGLYRVDKEQTFSAATVWNGELKFDGPDSALVVPRNQHAEFWQEGGITHYTWAAMPQDAFADWVLAADRRDDDGAARRYVSPEMTGYEDLDRYGRWDTSPDYGAVWIPTTVEAGWAPYRYGHWAWVAPWGWTWVDDAPWGFAPFHYGRWAWWRDRWCWVPGGYVARPVYAPALVGWVGGPSVNVSINIGSGPSVGWVPLAPRETYYPWYPAPRNHWRVINPHAPDRYYRPGEPSHGPIMYTNRGVPGGVTVVPVDVLKQRQPVAPIARRVDPHWAQQLVAQGPTTHVPPAPPTTSAPTPPGHRPPPVVRGVPAPTTARIQPVRPERPERDSRVAPLTAPQRDTSVPQLTAAQPDGAQMAAPPSPHGRVVVPQGARPSPMPASRPAPRERANEAAQGHREGPHGPAREAPPAARAQQTQQEQQEQQVQQPARAQHHEEKEKDNEGRRQRPRDPREGPRQQVQ